MVELSRKCLFTRGGHLIEVVLQFRVFDKCPK